MTDPAGTPGVNRKQEMLAAAASLHRPVPDHQPGMTSDLSIDEEFTLHSVGWEPVKLVCGASLFSVPYGVWSWGQGEIVSASAAFARAFEVASDHLHQECVKAGGRGVVGVHIERAVHRHHIDITLTGTAVRPVGAGGLSADPMFVSDLSGRDFALLHGSGWAPLGLAVGASFVYAPRRSLGSTMQQKGQNVELTNFTEAMYSARESAMERMQQSALSMDGTGVVEVKITEGPMDFAHHAIGFTAYGTVVKLTADQHRNLSPRMIVPLDDPDLGFDATSLR